MTAHPMITETLRRLNAFLHDLRTLIPESDEPQQQTANHASQLGVVLGALQQTLTKSRGPAAGLVVLAAHRLPNEHTDALVELDRIVATNKVRDVPRDPDITTDNITHGIEAATVAIRALPPGDDRAALSQQVGAMVGFLQGLIDAGGFDDTTFEATEVARRATRNLLDATQLYALRNDGPAN